MEAITDFPHTVIIALAHAIKYLSAFDVADVLREINFFARFAGRAHMVRLLHLVPDREAYIAILHRDS